MIAFLAKILSDDAGNPSSIRLAATVVTLLTGIVWAYASIKSGVIQPMPAEMLGLVASLWGIKAYQKGKEGNNG